MLAYKKPDPPTGYENGVIQAVYKTRQFCQAKERLNCGVLYIASDSWHDIKWLD